MASFPYDIAILTVLKEEYEAVLAELDPRPLRNTAPTFVNTYACREATVPSRKGDFEVVVGIVGEPTPVPMGIAVRQVITDWHPPYLLIVGIAAAVPGKGLALGDVAVARYIGDYEYGTIEQTPEHRTRRQFATSRGLFNNALALTTNNPAWAEALPLQSPIGSLSPNVHDGLVVSGSKVVNEVTSDFDMALDEWKDLNPIAIEMEGAGAADAIDKLPFADRPDFLMVRGISDIPHRSGQDTPSQSGGHDVRDLWKRYAATTAARFALALIRNDWPTTPAHTWSPSGFTSLDFEVSAFQQMGQNIFHVYEEGTPGGLARFLVKVHFRLWTKHEIAIVNVKLSYDMPHALPAEQKISINRPGPDDYEPTTTGYNMVTPRSIESGTSADVFISRHFLCGYAEADDYDYREVTIDMHLSGRTGFLTLRIKGTLQPGGCLSSIAHSVLPGHTTTP